MCRSRFALRCGVAALIFALQVADTGAVIIASGDGTGNTSAPADDPGWANVGLRLGLSAVYLGNRWVLTANHVGSGDVVFGGTSYSAVANSKVRMSNANATLADLIVFKIQTDPGLPALTIASSTPSVNKSVTMIGHGRNRGTATSWMGVSGWEWGPGQTMRWGTNHVSDNSVFVSNLNTQAFATTFDDLSGPSADDPEVQAATGDSGGAVFAKSGNNWLLVGTLFAIAPFVDQPAQTALFGNLTYSVDLASYRSQIQAVIDQPSCNDGLDDDGDGLIDYPDDPGCESASDTSEKTPNIACDDGVDNDGDSAIDYPADLQCDSPADAWETVTPAVPVLGIGSASGLPGILLVLGWASLLSRAHRDCSRRTRRAQ